MKKQILFLLIFSTCQCGLVAQPLVEIPQKQYHFGKIAEWQGLTTHQFAVINQGNEPLLIQKVIPDCGCTLPTWTLKPIAMQDTGYISITFNPVGQQGQFKKRVTVHTNGIPPVLFLEIEGEVVTTSSRQDTTTPLLNTLPPVRFTYWFDYNQKDVDAAQLYAKATELRRYYAQKQQPLTVKIIGSASFVPTKKYGSNYALARERAYQARALVANWLQQLEIPYYPIQLQAQVTGKKYIGDAQHRQRYRPFQYVFIEFD